MISAELLQAEEVDQAQFEQHVDDRTLRGEHTHVLDPVLSHGHPMRETP